MTENRPPWWRRARAPLPGWFRGRLRFAAVFFDAVVLVAALGTIVGDQPGWAKVVGGIVDLLFLGLTAVVVLHLRRPVEVPEVVDPIDHSLVAQWRLELEQTGVVAIAVSGRKAAKTLAAVGLVLVVVIGALIFGDVMMRIVGALVLALMVPFALVPHLEFVTGGRPALRVDSTGVHLARWRRLTIPWREVLEVYPYVAGPTQVSTVIVVSGPFFAEAVRARPWFLRPADQLMRGFAGTIITIPSTTEPNGQTLSSWLNDEAERRR